MDLPITKNYEKNIVYLRNFFQSNNLEVSLSKDSIVNKINEATYSKNYFLKKNNLKYHDKNFESRFISRVLNYD
jgi:hypothetical protein